MHEEENDGGQACADVLDWFLRDMNELDSQQLVVEADHDPRQPTADKPSAVCASRASRRRQREQTGTDQAAGTRKRRNQSWLRRKEELTSLREQTVQMETQVAFMLLLQEKAQLALPDPVGDLRKWKTAAAKERHLRQMAQTENAALKMKLRSYFQLSNSLQEMVTDERQVMASTGIVGFNLMETRKFQTSSPSIFRGLERRLDGRIHELQMISNDLKRAPAEEELGRIRVCKVSGQDTSVVEYKCATILPFDEHLTSTAAWTLIEVGGIPQKQLSLVVQRSENGYRVDSRFMFPRDRDGAVTVDVHLVVKRFVVPEGCILLAESNSDWSVNRGDTDTCNFTTQESMWGVVYRYPLRTPGISDRELYRGSGCQIKAVVRSETSRQHGPAESSSTISASAPDLVVSSVRKLIDSHLQFLENTLLDSAQATGR